MSENGALGTATTAFGIAAAATIVFSTLLAWAKDSSPRLLAIMNRIGGHNWITHGAADVLVFVSVGATLSRSRAGVARRVSAVWLIRCLVASVIFGGFGLFLWYLVV